LGLGNSETVFAGHNYRTYWFSACLFGRTKAEKQIGGGRKKGGNKKMNLQDIIAYGLAGAMIICFAYIAWASRKSKKEDKK
jgi:hypothetical protein